jgi:hypothetical protein
MQRNAKQRQRNIAAVYIHNTDGRGANTIRGQQTTVIILTCGPT